MVVFPHATPVQVESQVETREILFYFIIGTLLNNLALTSCKWFHTFSLVTNGIFHIVQKKCYPIIEKRLIEIGLNADLQTDPNSIPNKEKERSTLFC